MIGKILDGRYEIISKLGEGGFGATYLAIDRKLPDKDQCVVKHFSPKATDINTLSHARRLFETEAKVLNRLGNHDRVPRLLAHFEEDQKFYLVQEFVDGYDLSREINRNKQWSEEKVIALLQDILEPLEFLHQHHVIHRDIKPSNLMRRQEDGKIVLIDFGAVKQISSQGMNIQGQMTATVVVGTPGYIPSEQSQGQPRLCSDIYAVGIIAIEALTNLNPMQLPRDHLTGEIIWRDQAKVSSGLAQIIDKMVKYDFRQRYQSATEVLQALQELKIANHPQKSVLRKSFIGLGIAIAATSIAFIFIFIPRNNTLENYNNAVYGITIKYPENWEYTGTPDRITGNVVKFISPKESETDAYLENVNLIIQDLPENRRELEQFTKFYLDEIQQSDPNTKILEQGKTQLTNRPAYQVTYTLEEEGVKIQRLQVWMVKHNKAYIMTYTADVAKYSKYLQTAQAMINSLEIN
ncbi:MULTISPECIES: serine/threonine-protein kinase [Nostoc]|uniref:non-specific serine/threonine protein kinase n=1 Tax=Nostoc paludosum FACHB-159 TaxID=2692908 RepID=A0ABR8K5Z3_9NOSO|nr:MULTISPECIES: serine/threonine-protein kinase [Nostoc]MBD2683289.1 protein kinase [Nostoc sp. FACHB-857]MBD2733597.1 protein kinase [Nostoc paludosum FACHB-159]